VSARNGAGDDASFPHWYSLQPMAAAPGRLPIRVARYVSHEHMQQSKSAETGASWVRIKVYRPDYCLRLEGRCAVWTCQVGSDMTLWATHKVPQNQRLDAPVGNG
jgi:hypothetical protein